MHHTHSSQREVESRNGDGVGDGDGIEVLLLMGRPESIDCRERWVRESVSFERAVSTNHVKK